jgi:DNA segregation ATPase FtsK/SpoIIIE-like protein
MNKPLHKLISQLKLGYDQEGRAVTMPFDLLNRHMYVVGKSGSGKSKFLELLIRQLLTAWPYTRSGLLLIDPHHSLYSAAIKFAAAKGYNSLPIIPIDFTSNWICSLNILRRRPGQEPAPIIHAIVRAILHAWKQQDVVTTPQLDKILSTILTMLYHTNCTVFEALDVVRSVEVRRAMAREVEDALARTVLASFQNERDFQEQVNSTMNRLGRFLSTHILRLSFAAQTNVSLDMLQILQQGGIVLVSVATQGSRIAEEDAAVVGSLLLNELFVAAKHRGKRENGLYRTFTVLVDEAQEFISPVIAQSLAQLRGMGISFILSQQSPQQLVDLGSLGRQTLNAILTNTTTQIAFHAGHPADLDLLTPWLYRSMVDVNKIKFTPVSTKVLGHKLEYFQGFNESLSEATSEQSNWATTETEVVTDTSSHGHVETHGQSKGKQSGRTIGKNVQSTHGSGKSQAESNAKSHADGTTVSRSGSRTHQQGNSEAETRHLDGSNNDLRKVVGPKPTADFNQAYVDEFEEHGGLRRSIGRSAAKNESRSDSEATGVAKTHSEAKAHAVQDVNSYNQSLSQGESEAANSGETNTDSVQFAESPQEGESYAQGTARMKGGAKSNTRATTRGTSLNPTLVPVFGKEEGAPIYQTVEEQLFEHGQTIAGLPDQHAVVKTGNNQPVIIQIPTLEEPAITDKGARIWTEMKLRQLPFAMPIELADQKLAERRQEFTDKYLGDRATGEPNSFVRRIKE